MSLPGDFNLRTSFDSPNPAARDAPNSSSSEGRGPPPIPQTKHLEVEPFLYPITVCFRPKPSLEQLYSRVPLDDLSQLFPTLASSSRELEPSDRVRLQEAIDHGTIYFPYRTALSQYGAEHNFLSRNQESNTFTPVLRSLRRVLTVVRIDQTQDDPALYVNETSYQSLMGLLEVCLLAAKPRFLATNKSVPPLPMWGRDTRFIHYAYGANDFEILGACFRREVEFFLSELVSVHGGPFIPGGVSAQAHDAAKEPVVKSGSMEGVSRRSDTSSAVASDLSDATSYRLRRATSGSTTPIPRERHSRTKREASPDVKLMTTPQLSARSASGPLWAHTAATARGTAAGTSTVPATKHVQHSLSVRPRVTAASHTHPSDLPTGLARLFRRTRLDERPVSEPPPLANDDPDPSDSDSSDDGSTSDRSSHQNQQVPPWHGSRCSHQPTFAQQPPNSRPQEAHFAFKLKADIVPTWDGNPSTLARWILRVNSVAKRSATIRQQLGMVVPHRLVGDAERWYFSLSDDIRDQCELDWENLRDVIRSYYMNRSWVEKTRKQALALYFRQPGHADESPSQYFIRKRELLELVFGDNSESELISDIMAGAPLAWKTILTPRLYRTTAQLQRAIKMHEDDLLTMEEFLSGEQEGSIYNN